MSEIECGVPARAEIKDLHILSVIKMALIGLYFMN